MKLFGLAVILGDKQFRCTKQIETRMNFLEAQFLFDRSFFLLIKIKWKIKNESKMFFLSTFCAVIYGTKSLIISSRVTILEP